MPITLNFKAVAIATLCALSAGSAKAADTVTLALDWIVNGTHAGYFVADAQGYYRDAGMDVSLSRGFGSGDTVKRIGAGAATFGVADTSTVIASVANEDIPVQIVAMVFGKAPLGVIYLKESGIEKPSDLEGKKIARSASGSSVVMFPGFLKANDLDRSSMEEVVADANTLLSLLMSRRVDAVLGQTINLGRYQEVAKEQGLTAAGMNYSDHGLEAYGNAIIANPETIQQNPDLVRRFVAASVKGIAYAISHPDEAIAIMKQANPEIDANAAKEELIGLRSFATSGDAEVKGIGYINPERMAATIATVSSALPLKREPAPEEIFTSEFLPAEAILPTE